MGNIIISTTLKSENPVAHRCQHPLPLECFISSAFSITHQIKNYQNLYETLRARRCDTTSGRLIRLKPSGSIHHHLIECPFFGSLGLRPEKPVQPSAQQCSIDISQHILNVNTRLHKNSTMCSSSSSLSATY